MKSKNVGTPDIRGAEDWEVVEFDSGSTSEEAADETHSFERPTRGLSWATDGVVVVVKANGQQGTIPAGSLAAQQIHPIRGVTAIVEEGTTATGIIGWFEK